MIHPRIAGVWAGELGPYGAWGDVTWSTRWESGAVGMFEASFTMPLPAGFSHRVLVRGSRVELMRKGRRVGSSLVITQIERGTSGEPWTITCEGVGRLVEGQSSFYAFDAAGAATTTPSVAVDQAIVRGLPWAGRDASVPTTAFGTPAEPQAIGALLDSVADANGTHWGVGDDDKVAFYSDPTTPVWQLAPPAPQLGTAGDDYATVVYVRYTNSATGTNATVHSPATTPADEDVTGRQEYLANLTNAAGYPSMTTATAQGYADAIYARAKRRIAFTDRLEVTSNQLLTIGGQAADLSQVRAGQMVRANGVRDPLLASTGKTYLDFVIGETSCTDGAQTVGIAPAGLAARDFASVIEDITGMAAAS